MMDGPPCLVYTRDTDLARRITGFTRSAMQIKQLQEPESLKLALQQSASSLLLLDVRGTGNLDLLREVTESWPETLVIALGSPRSEPILRARDLGVYAAVDPDFDGADFRVRIEQALTHLHLALEVRMLREKLAEQSASVAVARPPDAKHDAGLPLRHALPPLRHFDNVENLLQSIIDGISNTAVVLRAGVFAWEPVTKVYRMKAGIGCRDETRCLLVRSDDPLVRWLEIHAQIVSREGLRHVQNVTDRLKLERTLDSMGAELIAPLRGRERIIGWMFFGARATGLPFEQSDLQDVALFAEHVATALENSMLYREAALQKVFAETLLHTIPTGIVAAGTDGRVHWFNDAAERILGTCSREAMNLPVEVLGSRLAHLLREALQGDASLRGPHEWQEPVTKFFLSVHAARLMSGSECLGAVAFIHDTTHERMLNRKQQELDRAAFWTELAASMSHEIRNPLVTIKTFAQLLPERFEEPEFRKEFSTLMSQEVDRLNAVIEQMNSFANLPKPVLVRLGIRDMLEEGVRIAKIRTSSDRVDAQIFMRENLPPVLGDRSALAECVGHVLTNSIEALAAKPDGHIRISVKASLSADGERCVQIAIEDNGPGIPRDIQSKVFSPFCTTKNRTMGLGLPIVQRTLADHNGHVSVASDEKGTCVKIDLPADTSNHGETS